MSVSEPTVKNAVPRTTLRLPAAVTGPLIGLVAVLALFIVLIGIKGGLANFLSVRNLQVLVHEATIPGVVALGMLLVIISGGIDLSVGSILALVTVVTMQTYRYLLASSNSMGTRKPRRRRRWDRGRRSMRIDEWDRHHAAQTPTVRSDARYARDRARRGDLAGR